MIEKQIQQILVILGRNAAGRNLGRVVHLLKIPCEKNVNFFNILRTERSV